MNSSDIVADAGTVCPLASTERLFHPKDGALAQQPEAERAPHGAVERPQAAGKSRPTSPMSVCAFVSFAADGSVSAMVSSSKGDRGQKLAERAGAVDCFVVANPEHKEYWFEPTSRDSLFCFLVQDRLRASDVLHRDWDWSAWR
jgi:hypothetical protein